MLKIANLFSRHALSKITPFVFAKLNQKIMLRFSVNPLKAFQQTKDYYVINLNNKITNQTQWKYILSKCDQRSRKVISKIISLEQMRGSQSYISALSQISKQIGAYLEYDALGVHADRTMKGLTALMLAIDESKQLEIKKFKTKIVEFIVLQNLQLTQYEYLKISEKEYNQKLIKLIYEGLVVKTVTCQHKNLKTKYQNHAINFFKSVFPIISKNLWPYFLLGLNSFKSKYTILSRFKLHMVAEVVENSIITLLKNNNNLENKLTLDRFYLIKEFLILLEDISFHNYQNAVLIAEALPQLKCLSSITRNNFICQKWSRIYLAFPNSLPISNDPLPKSTINAKDIVYKHYQHIFNTNSIFRQQFQKMPENLLGLVFKDVMQSKFYTMFHQLPFQVIGTETIVRQMKLVPPSLGDFAWNTFFKSDGQINAIIYSAAKVIYQHKLTNKGPILKSSKNIFYPNAVIDNETNYKINLALDSLGVTYIKDHKIKQRPVDYYIPSMNVIIQMDGDIHEQIQTGEPNVKTCFRNMCFMLMGYRIVILTLHQYNSYRQLESFRLLIAKKLKLVKQYNAIYVY